MTKDYPWGKGTPMWIRDSTANDSDKSFTVPAGKIWDIKSVLVQITTTATVGSRNLRIGVTDGTNPIYSSEQTASIAASKVGQFWLAPGGTVAGTTAVMGRIDALGATSGDNALRCPCSPMILPAGYVIRIWDTAAVDVAADDMIVVIHYVEYDA